jgi:purine-nucleoside phosphorylase
VITDHINLMGMNPLIGKYDQSLGTRFPDMSEPYSKRLCNLAHEAATELRIKLYNTIYAAVSGPSFETEAEIRMLQTLGVDTIGMSVIPEVLVARQLDMEVLGLTAITDQSLPGAMSPVSHDAVSKVAAELGPKFRSLVRKIIQKL